MTAFIVMLPSNCCCGDFSAVSYTFVHGEKGYPCFLRVLGSVFCMRSVSGRDLVSLSLFPKRLKRYKAVGLTTGILMCEDESR